MSTAVGLAIADGKLSLDDRLAEFFPEAVPENAQPELFEIRLRHLLMMSSGFHEPYLMGANRRAGVGAPDYVKYMLSRPVKVQPGSEFVYSTADSILAGRMVERSDTRPYLLPNPGPQTFLPPEGSADSQTFCLCL